MTYNNLASYLYQNAPLLGIKTLEQINLVLLSVFIALCVGIPLGIFTARSKRFKTFILRTTSVLWTIPSLALLAFFIPFFGIGVKPAIFTLAIYALLPILRNTVSGIDTIPAENIEAAKAMGFTPWQRLKIVEIPLALPIIITGVRTAVSITVGVATLAAFIGAGGLGDFINQGLALNDTRLILLGAIPAAILALIFDYLIGQLENFVIFRRKMTPELRKRNNRYLIVAMALIALIMTGLGLYIIERSDRPVIRVGTKNFTEQYILGEILAQMVEHHTNLQVRRKFNLGTTAICHQAMVSGDIDIYPEYSGTAYLTILHKNYDQNLKEIFNIVQKEYLEKFHIVWLSPFGFNNSQALAVTKDLAQKYQLHNISDLTPIQNQLIIGGPAEFIERPDGLIGLTKVYGLHFRKIVQMDPGLIYQALENDAVNLITAFSTDGRIIQYQLKILIDNKHFYPPYQAAPLVREAVLKKYPKIKDALAPLSDVLDNHTMQQLNYQVDVLKKSPYDVAHGFLQAKHLL